jgi:hypothetical protein
MYVHGEVPASQLAFTMRNNKYVAMIMRPIAVVEPSFYVGRPVCVLGQARSCISMQVGWEGWLSKTRILLSRPFGPTEKPN